jgi:hypothetical protein
MGRIAASNLPIVVGPWTARSVRAPYWFPFLSASQTYPIDPDG